MVYETMQQAYTATCKERDELSRKLHETKSELGRILAALRENCVCDLCGNRESIDNCEELKPCGECVKYRCPCKRCGQDHSNFELRNEIQYGRDKT